MEEALVASAAPVRMRGTRRRTALWKWPTKPYLLLLPSLVFLALFTYLPILEVGWSSLFRTGFGQKSAAFVGLENYARVLADAAFRKAVLNNVLYAVGTIVPSLVIALFLALLLDGSSRFKAVIRGFVFLPTLIPLVAAAALFSFIFLPSIGLLDHYLAMLGLRGFNWLGDPDIALWSLTLVTIWKNAGYYMLFYLAGLQAIPLEAHEAAILEGATFLQRLRHVVLPLLKPTTAFVLVIALVNVITAVDHVVVMTKGGPDNATKLVLYYIYQAAVESYEPGKAAAATVLSVALLLALSIVSLKTLQQGGRHES